jgi:hypothetical protein
MTQSNTTSRPRSRRLFWVFGGLVVLVVLIVAGGVLAVQMGAIPNPFRPQPAPLPTPAATRDGRWQQDVEYLSSQLVALHPNAFHSTPRETYDAATTALVSAIPTLQDHQIMAEMVRLAALLGDGHTYVNPYNEGHFRLYPLEAAWYGDEFLVTAAAPEYEQAIGTTITRIGETDIGAAFERLTPYIEHDNLQQLRSSSGLVLLTPEFLHTAGLITDMESAPFTFEGADGQPFTLNLVPGALGAPSADWIGIYAKFAVERPLWAQNRDKNYWYTYLEDSGTVFFQYNRCANDPDQPFEQFASEMFAFIDANPVQRVIIDLRFNGGGNSTVIKPFIDGMRTRSALNTEDTFFAFIGRGTFSSALMNAIDLATQTNATLVGEGTGGKPNGYGEVRDFTLPNSGLPVQYSTRFFNNVPGYEGDSYEPDREIVMTAEDVLAGRDPLLETAIVWQ